MPRIYPMPAIGYPQTTQPSGQQTVDISDLIAPPYDVLDEEKKSAMVSKNAQNISVIDLPYMPPKVVGPDEVYIEAGETFNRWQQMGQLTQREKPALYIYVQTYTATIAGETKTFDRKSVQCNLSLQEFGPAEGGGIFAHEQTFASGKEDRLKLMRATKAQMSAIFGLYSDPENKVSDALDEIIASRPADFVGTTPNDGVKHSVWVVEDEVGIQSLQALLDGKDVFIADGHHRYNTALNYRRELIAENSGLSLADDHPANRCLFVMVALQDPGMIILPTHRTLGGMQGFSMDQLKEISQEKLNWESFVGSLEDLEAKLPESGPHAMGFYDGENKYIVNTKEADPLATLYSESSDAWRQLDVAVLQHLVVETMLQTAFCQLGEKVSWKFPHEISQLHKLIDEGTFQLGVIMQATPLEAVKNVSEAGELMPQKSTFFYPKIATGLAINPLG